MRCLQFPPTNAKRGLCRIDGFCHDPEPLLRPKIPSLNKERERRGRSTLRAVLQFGGNRFGAAFCISDELCNSSPMAYNSTRGLRNRRAYACRFPGTVLAWGRQNRGREQSLNPVIQLLLSTLVVLVLFYLQRRCQTTKSFNQLG